MLEPAPLTRRRALHLALGAAVAGVAALAGCSSGSGERDDPGAADPADDPAADAAPEGASGGGIVMYASPSCGCCGQYAAYLESEGHSVEVERTDRVDAIRSDAGVPDAAAGCHTTMFGEYVVEGHVPAEAIARLLRDRPAVDGISLPGMPSGSPGMSGAKETPFEILSFTGGRTRPYMTV